jgi:hypothetical protein
LPSSRRSRGTAFCDAVGGTPSTALLVDISESRIATPELTELNFDHWLLSRVQPKMVCWQHILKKPKLISQDPDKFVSYKLI